MSSLTVLVVGRAVIYKDFGGGLGFARIVLQKYCLPDK